MLWLKGMIGLYTFRSSLKNLLCTDHRPTRWGGILIGWVPIVYGQRSALTSIDARHRRYGVKDAASSDRHPIYDRTSYASQPCWLFSLQQLNRKSLGISIIMLGVLLFLLSRQEYMTALMPLFFPLHGLVQYVSQHWHHQDIFILCTVVSISDSDTIVITHLTDHWATRKCTHGSEILNETDSE